MKKKRLCVAMLVLCLLLTACQPTPEEEIVTNKGDGVMEEKIFSSPVPVTDTAELPSHWTETIHISDAISVAIDCDVRWGDETVYHVKSARKPSSRLKWLFKLATPSLEILSVYGSRKPAMMSYWKP